MMMKLKKQRHEAIESVNQSLEKMKKDQEILNAVVTFVDPQEQLKEFDSKIDGKMAGVPIALKDNVITKGIRTTGSSKILDNYIPIYDAHITEKLKEAGAIIIAKASMDELGMGGSNRNAATGPVANPWDTSRIAGGSSGGSAALVASGVVPFAIGTDTGDSVRKPAAYCGIIGVKPTYGRISRYGIIPYASSLDHVGYFTTNVYDAAVGLEVLAGRDDRDMTSANEKVEEYSELLTGNIQGKTIGIFKNVVDSSTNIEVNEQFNQLVEKLKSKGAIFKEIYLNQELLRAILPTYYLIANCEATANHANLDALRFGVQQEGETAEEIMMKSRTEGFGLFLRKRLMVGSYGLFIENQEKLFNKAKRVRRLLVEELKKAMEEVDCLIAPATPTIAGKIEDTSLSQDVSDENLVSDNFMILGNFSGYPSMTLPMGFSEGCPTAINITCRPFEEVLMFNVAQMIEENTGLKDQVAEVKAG